MCVSRWYWVSGLAALLLSWQVFATTYPLTVTDLSGQKVTLAHEPKRIVIQDGRDILSLALLDRNNPFQRVVAWNNLLRKNDKSTWDLMAKRWPASQKILDMNFSDQGEINLEQVIQQHPDLMIAQWRAKPALIQSGVLVQLQKLAIPVVFVDMEKDPLADTRTSIMLMGKILNRESEAKAYVDFYTRHLDVVEQAIAKVGKKPNVFVEAKAGQSGTDECCFTHGQVGWGTLVEAAGGQNLGTSLLPGAYGDVGMEKLLSVQPDIYVMTGSQWSAKGSVALPFGYHTSIDKINASFAVLENRPGFKELHAYQQGRVYGVYHQFYNHPYNIVAIEALAKDFYPVPLKSLAPEQTYAKIISQFTQLPQQPVILSAQTPAQTH